jgi:flagellar basal-body rod modification protein FlgD
MDLASALQGPELSKLKNQVEAFNTAINGDRSADKTMGKDDFLKILLTQLTHQDPTEPMEDKEFVAQMAQFSTLEQMTNLSGEFSRLANLVSAGQAVSLLGKTVDILNGDTVISGTVSEVTGGEFPQVLVNGTYFDYADVQRVKQ